MEICKFIQKKFRIITSKEVGKIMKSEKFIVSNDELSY